MVWSLRTVRGVPFSYTLLAACILRVTLVLYSEWHDARSIVKYTDVDYRVFSDATRFLLNPGPENRAKGFLDRWINVGVGEYVSRLFGVCAGY